MIYSFINLKPVKNYATYQVKQIKQNQIKSEQNKNSLKTVFCYTVPSRTSMISYMHQVSYSLMLYPYPSPGMKFLHSLQGQFLGVQDLI